MKRTIYRTVAVALAGDLMITMFQECEKGKMNGSPIKIKYNDLNNDKIEDRILSNKAGLYQEQFGYKNPKTGEIEYLTLDEIQSRVKSELESKFFKYRDKQERILK
jgi:hypothetical protein